MPAASGREYSVTPAGKPVQSQAAPFCVDQPVSQSSYDEIVQGLNEANDRLSFDASVDIDWDAPENSLDANDPRWQLDPGIVPLAATEWYARQPLQKRIDMGRWAMANVLKVSLQFEMMLLRGVVHYAGSLPNGSSVFRYLISELADECHHIQMFQAFINRTGDDVPGMRRGARLFGPLLSFLAGYANILLFIGVLCGEQPLHFQQTLQHRGAAQVPPLLNKITYIHLAEEARHVTFADAYLAHRIETAGWFKRAVYAVAFPFLLRWLIGEMMTPPRAFAREFDIPRRVFKAAYWRSARSRQMLEQSAADVRRLADELGLRTSYTRWIWRLLGVEGRIPRYRGEPDRSPLAVDVDGYWPITKGRLSAAAMMAGIALAVTPVGVRIIVAAAVGAGLWLAYHLLRERRGGVHGNQPFEWPRLMVWVFVCVAMIPIGGLIGLATLVFMILALSEFVPTL